jgi:hypothetical protein
MGVAAASQPATKMRAIVIGRLFIAIEDMWLARGVLIVGDKAAFGSALKRSPLAPR